MKVVVFASVVLFAAIPLLAQDRHKIDPDDAYKNNCTRCHSSVKQYPARMMQTIMMHKRVRARISEKETKAILEYFNDSPPEPKSKKSAAETAPAPNAGADLHNQDSGRAKE